MFPLPSDVNEAGNDLRGLDSLVREFYDTFSTLSC
jgi:hypothetical protein